MICVEIWEIRKNFSKKIIFWTIWIIIILFSYDYYYLKSFLINLRKIKENRCMFKIETYKNNNHKKILILFIKFPQSLLFWKLFQILLSLRLCHLALLLMVISAFCVNHLKMGFKITTTIWWYKTILIVEIKAIAPKYFCSLFFFFFF